MGIGRRVRVVGSVLATFLIAGCSLRIGGPVYGDTVDGIACDRGRAVSFEATIHLWLVNGDQREMPTGGVGSTGSACNYWVRTEDDGFIHIRAPHSVSPTLETFFAIWDLAIPRGSGNSQPFRDAAEHGRIVVNGTQAQGGPASVALADGDTIELLAP